MKKLLLVCGIAALLCGCGAKSPVDKSILKPLTETELLNIDKEFPQYAEMCRGIQEYNLAENLNDAQKASYKQITYRRLGDFVNFVSEKNLFEFAPDELTEKDALCFEFAVMLLGSWLGDETYIDTPAIEEEILFEE